MKVKLTESRATVVDGQTVAQHAGEEITVSGDEAKALLQSGAATPVARTKSKAAETRG